MTIPAWSQKEKKGKRKNGVIVALGWPDEPLKGYTPPPNQNILKQTTIDSLTNILKLEGFLDNLDSIDFRKMKERLERSEVESIVDIIKSIPKVTYSPFSVEVMLSKDYNNNFTEVIPNIKTFTKGWFTPSNVKITYIDNPSDDAMIYEKIGQIQFYFRCQNSYKIQNERDLAYMLADILYKYNYEKKFYYIPDNTTKTRKFRITFIKFLLLTDPQAAFLKSSCKLKLIPITFQLKD
jgi:hypothetical protein